MTNQEALPEKLHFLDYWRIVRVRKAIIIAVWILVVLSTVLGTLYWYKYKPTFASMARISVDRDTRDVSGPFENSQTPYGADPFWIQTQFEKITSRTVLYRVIKEMELDKRWSTRFHLEKPLTEDETFDILERQIHAKQSHNTSNIEIWVYSGDKAEAAEIANKIAEAYKNVRLDQRREIKNRGIKILEQRLKEKDDEVERLQRVVADMRRTNNIIDMGEGSSQLGGASSSAPGLPTETLRHFEGLRVDRLADFVKDSTLLDQIKSIDREGLRNALPTAVPDAALAELLSNHILAQARLGSLSSDLGNDNPEITKARSIVDKYEREINDKIAGMVKGLETKVASQKAELAAIEAEVEKAKQEQISVSAKYRPYYDAKDDLTKERQVRDALKMKIDQEAIDASMSVSMIAEVVDSAVPAKEPAFPKIVVNVVVGILGGLILGVGLAFFVEYLDTNVKTIDDVERALQTPVLGVIPQDVGLILNEGAESPHAEAYRVLRTNILFSRKENGYNSLTIVSGGVGEGKSTTIMNLATAFAQNGDRVLIVDSDLRRPTLHKILELSNSIGLTDCLLGQASLDQAIKQTKLPMLSFLPSGKLPSSSMGILSSSQMKDLIQELKRRYDFVFFDSPPIMGVSDASILVSEVDMTLQVVQYRRYPMAMTLRAKQMIQKNGGNLLGVVLNNISVGAGDNYYYYSGYYYSRRDDDDDKKRKPRNDGQPALKA